MKKNGLSFVQINEKNNDLLTNINQLAISGLRCNQILDDDIYRYIECIPNQDNEGLYQIEQNLKKIVTLFKGTVDFIETKDQETLLKNQRIFSNMNIDTIINKNQIPLFSRSPKKEIQKEIEEIEEIKIYDKFERTVKIAVDCAELGILGKLQQAVEKQVQLSQANSYTSQRYIVAENDNILEKYIEDEIYIGYRQGNFNFENFYRNLHQNL